MPTLDEINVVVNQEDIVVLGPPNNIELFVDIGSQGIRGSKIWAGAGTPPDANASSTPWGAPENLLVNDWYINVTPGPDYGWLYQYQSTLGSSQWALMLKISPPIYRATTEIAFTAGVGTVTIPVSNIIGTSVVPVVGDNFVTSFTFNNAYPVAYAVTSQVVSNNNLVITLSAGDFRPSFTQLSSSIPAQISVISTLL